MLAHPNTLAAFNAWANQRLYAACSTLAPDEIAKNRGNFAELRRKVDPPPGAEGPSAVLTDLRMVPENFTDLSRMLQYRIHWGRIQLD